MQSIDIPYRRGMDYGVGVNVLTGEMCGRGVVPGPITAPSGADGQTVNYNLTIVNTLEELYSSIGVSVEASGHYGLFSADGKFAFANETKFNSQSTFVVARCVVGNPFTQCLDATLEEPAAELIRQGHNDVFQERFGSGFVRGMQTGGEFYVVMSISSSNREEQQNIAASLQAEYGGTLVGAGVELNAEVNLAMREKISKSEFRAFTYQKGGVGEEQSFARDIQ